MQDIEGMLLEAAFASIEGLALAYVEETTELEPREGCATTCVPFSGPVIGHLHLRVDPDVLEVLSANMLGTLEPPSADMQQDALGEIANVTCGNLLPRMAGRSAVFNLGAPVCGCRLTRVMTARVRLNVDGGCAEATLFRVGAAA